MGPLVRSVRRYPVKSMGGEDLRSVELDERGLVGDRWFAVVDTDGRLASGKDSTRFRRRDAVFGFHAQTAPGGVQVAGIGGTWQVGDPALDAHLSEQMGAQVRVRPERETPHQDSGQVSLVGTATLWWCAQRWGIYADPRRLRVNIVVETDEPFVEETWVGREAAMGSARLRVTARVPRCRMIDIDQDGARATGRWLTGLGAERDLCVAVYADVVRPGVLGIGDEVVIG